MNTTQIIDPEKVARLDSLVLAGGSHSTFEAGACFNEAAAYLAGERHSDAPACVSPALLLIEAA